MFSIKRLLLPTLFALSFVVLPALAFADNPPSQTSGLPASQNSGLPPSQTSGGQTVNANPRSYDIQNPLGVGSFCGLVKKLLQVAIQIGIPVAVLFIVYAGFKFVVAQGNPEKLAEARHNFLWTIIGIAIFLSAWLLATVIANTVNQLGGNQNIISCQ